ncbi:MAG: hypothetical protein ACRD3L_06790 [Terriglobales bacterium]
MNLTGQGEREAIRYRSEQKAGKEAMAEAVEQIKKDEAKDKK